MRHNNLPMLFQSLTSKLHETLRSLMGSQRLSESNLEDATRAIRNALLDADVALPIAKEFVERVRTKAIGEKVIGSLSPAQMFIKIVNDELTRLLGEATAELDFNAKKPIIILVAGLQGSGKTTTIAKLAKLIKEQYKKDILLTSVDIYRPAAIEQLKLLAKQIETDFFEYPDSQDLTKAKPVEIAKKAMEYAKAKQHDILMIDTAGRLHIDDAMMKEIMDIHAEVNPVETLFIIDSMIGQDAVNTAKAFNEALPLTGVILTKTDGDARGGAALSVYMTIGKPIKFMGTGEKLNALEIFHPDRMASRILGMGDIVTLAEDVIQKVDQAKAEKLAKKIKKGSGFDFEDFLEQLEQMNKLGGVKSLLNKLPGMASIPDAVRNQVDDGMFNEIKAIIQSMTIKERRFPDLILRGARKQRIAKGSGTDIIKVNKMLRQFSQMQKMMERLSKPGGMFKLAAQMKNLFPM